MHLMTMRGILSFCAVAVAATAVAAPSAFRAPVTVTGMVNAANELVLPDDSVTFRSDGKNLFFRYEGAARNNDPGGGLVAKVEKRDGHVYNDDNVALVFCEQPGKILRHIAFNLKGTVFDRMRRGNAKWDVSWNAEGLRVLSSEARSGRWTLEASVPLASVGISDATVVNVLRESPGRRPAFLRSTRAAFNGKGLTLVRLSVASRNDPEVFENPFEARLPKPPNRARLGGIVPSSEFKVGGTDGVVQYYPGLNRMRVNVAGADPVPVLLFCGKRIAMSKKESIHTVLTDVPSVPGRYPISLEVDGKLYPDVTYVEKRNEPWEGNSIGKSDIVLPPFTPVRKAEPSALSVIHRTYTFDGAGLPRSVVALGREILAGGIGYEVGRAGKTTALVPGSEPGITVSASGTKAVVAGSASCDGVRISSCGNFEYDGFLWNEIEITGAGAIDRLMLTVPLKDGEAPLFHAVAPDTIRNNPSGCVPAGPGTVWDGTKLFRKPQAPDDLYAPSVVPYIWLGAERRGLCVFVNDTKGMALDPVKPSVRIVRKSGVLRLEYDLVNVTTKLDGVRRISFGLQATPVKTADKALARDYQGPNVTRPTNMIARVGIDWRTSGFENHWSRVPKDGNWKLFTDAMSRSCSVADSYPFKYSDPTLTWEKDEAVRYYASEWISRPTGYEGAVRTFLVPSSIDYVLYRHNEWLDLGLKGLYFDDMFLIPCRNPDTAGGSFGILEMRELVKRAAVMQHEKGFAKRLLQIHMTNALLVPSFAFATSLLTWEDHYGEDRFEKRFPVDFVRAEGLGTQVGCESIALDGIKRLVTPVKDWKGKFRFLTRNQHAILLPSGMRMWSRSARGVDKAEQFRILKPLAMFEVWAEDCAFVPYWEDDGKLGSVPPGVLASSYRREREWLAVLGNPTEQDQTVTLGCGRRYRNAETGETIPGGTVKVPSGDVRLVFAERGE